ncbi:TAXI family TRAP transporter solute-binding subunit [Propylenella binzhouense]|uniref:TAXI family TRAP transporter solute-binding subunit n=1 Tax=Propylenella binzhouense TaxID=2555902 RepID=A0A964T631_9HYPH|nr:TAXI family TRAP transporter solute-binding subunit [Propylenella binzhouense]MYZ49211.1 TAXI family TRAP transporter solute-binding subunit [Propylenella binzhouense]
MLKLIGAAFAAALTAGLAQAQTVGIAVGNPGSLYHNAGTAIAKVANEAGMKVTIQPMTSPTQYIPVVNAGDVEFGLGNLQEVREGVLGESYFKGRPNEHLKAVSVLFPLKNGLWVRKDSDIKSVADLKGRRVAAGYTAQKTLQQVLLGVLATGGLTLDDIEAVPVPTVVAGAEAFMAGEVDAFIFAVGSSKVREVEASVGGIRGVTIADTPENVKAMREFFPAAYLYQQEPGPGAPGIDGPTNVLTYPALIFASDQTPEDLVYEMTKVLHDNKKGMAEVFVNFKEFEQKEMVADLAPLSYHPGAIKYYKEQGLWKE